MFGSFAFFIVIVVEESNTRKHRQVVNNHFLCEGIYTVDDLLTLDSLDGLAARRGLG